YLWSYRLDLGLLYESTEANCDEAPDPEWRKDLLAALDQFHWFQVVSSKPNANPRITSRSRAEDGLMEGGSPPVWEAPPSVEISPDSRCWLGVVNGRRMWVTQEGEVFRAYAGEGSLCATGGVARSESKTGWSPIITGIEWQTA